MLSNRTAEFGKDKIVEKKEEISDINDNEDSDIIYQKSKTAFDPKIMKLNANFSSLGEGANDNDEKFNSGFSFTDELLTKGTYDFLKQKEICLREMVLDDTIPEDKNESSNNK